MLYEECYINEIDLISLWSNNNMLVIPQLVNTLASLFAIVLCSLKSLGITYKTNLYTEDSHVDDFFLLFLLVMIMMLMCAINFSYPQSRLMQSC